jgi:hypothetical protein
MKRKRERERERGRGLIQRPVERGGPWASVAPRGRAACAACARILSACCASSHLSHAA